MSRTVKDLEKKAQWVRRNVLEAVSCAKRGHIGGALSCVDILVALYYGGILRFDPHNAKWAKRDRLIMSKGHSAIALYAILADLGLFPLSELDSFCKNGSILGGHPDRNIPGIEVNTGALGHGLGIGAGLALSAVMDEKDFLTIVLLGDGECYEGSVWEAAMFAGHHQLNNLLAIIDRNGQCVTDFTEECNRLEPFLGKWKMFGWEVREIDGHSFDALFNSMKDLHSRNSSRPLVVIARTIKGKGISFMEGKLAWHHRIPTPKELRAAKVELKR